MKIVAIGGGEIGRPGYPIETEAIDREIIQLTGKEHPTALLLPTASGDSEVYWETFDNYFGQRLGCRTDVLYLVRESPSQQEIHRKILGTDIIYVGGGNTAKMLQIWRQSGIDQLLITAGQQGTVLSGLSAGAICWFASGNSDFEKYADPAAGKLIRIQGLGLVPCMACPHYDVEQDRRPSLRKIIAQTGGIALGIENCAALEVVDRTYRVLTSSPGANVYRLYKQDHAVIEEQLPKDGRFRPVEELC